MNWKRILSLIAVLALAGMLGACGLAVKPAEPTPEPADAAETPAGEDEGLVFELTGLMGETVSDEIMRRNRLTMVNFWATWCGPCVGEMPDLSRIHEDYAEKGFGIIGVLTWDDNIDGAKGFLEENGISYPVVNLESPFTGYAADLYGIPTTFFFDAEGRQVGDPVVGGMDYDDWAKLIDAMLERVP